MNTTQWALAGEIPAAQRGARLGDSSSAIVSIEVEPGLRVNTQFDGHGVGRTMRGDPHIPNDGRRGRGLLLTAGLVIAIELWLSNSTDQIRTDEGGWTCAAWTGRAERTVAITDEGLLVLTRPDRNPMPKGDSPAA